MRRLLPDPSPDPLDDDALLETAAFPPASRWVRGVMVASVDGGTVVEGRSRGLSGPADARWFARLRDLPDVVLVGAGTARAEDYAAVHPSEARVGWRAAHGLSPTPPIAVVTGSLALDPASALFRGAAARTILVTTERAARERGAAYEADLVTTPGERVDVAAALDALHARGLRRVSCEGGATLLGQVAAAGRLDEVCLTTSPLVVGGEAPRAAHGPLVLPPQRMRLAALLEDDGSLFARYVRS